MNKFLNSIERKIGKYAIRNLSLYIIIAYVLGYLLGFTGSLEFISLNPYKIIHELQIWRVLTWILVPPSSPDIFTIIMLYFYYQIGTALERTWGAFRYNVYIFSGIIFTIIGAFALYFITTFNGAVPADAGYFISTGFSTLYINMSIFLAFATTYPNLQVLLFFVIPVKVKWMAYIYGVMLIYQFIFNSGSADRFAIVMSLLNFIVFFLTTRNYRSISPKEMYRKRAYRNATQTASSSAQAARSNVITKHKCAICGRTEKDGEDLEFRFCSKCNGNYEYCNEHLFTHKHVE